MEKVISKEKCCGCSACYNICPKSAITMQEDINGFHYPIINEEKCINCHLCQKNCPILNKTKKQLDYGERLAYACYNKNLPDRLNSSSGGVFALLAKNIIKRNGLVVGAQFNEDFLVEHTIVTKEDELEKLYGSKYVESNINKIYTEIKSYLEDGKTVFFAGTPCEIYGLKNYLKRDYDNLYTQDIICHGVPSKKVWRKYLNYISKNEKIKKINFRNKKYGWNNFSMSIDTIRKKYNASHYDDPYMQFFLSNICLRQSCYDCQFKKGQIASDITLGDFWGIDKFDEAMNDNKGTSLLILNSDKGKLLFNEIKNDIVLKKINLEEVVPYNSALEKSVELNDKRSDFLNDLDSLSFDELFTKYGVRKSKLKMRFETLKKEIKRRIKK